MEAGTVNGNLTGAIHKPSVIQGRFSRSVVLTQRGNPAQGGPDEDMEGEGGFQPVFIFKTKRGQHVQFQ
jgi:hypothetical protein